MAGIYLHIPYCKQACTYCDFHFSTNVKTSAAMVEAMLAEMELRKDFLTETEIRTIYFGGGTPSILEISALSALMDKIRSLWKVVPEVEITLEANPDDLTLPTLHKLQSAGVNRLSIGIQSFFQEHLKWMNRGHNASQAENCIDHAREAGFSNFTIDLIYGFPLLTDQQWRSNINRAIELQVPHISCYSLTVESGTALDKFIRAGRQVPPDDKQSVRQFQMLIDILTAAGYEHYEVSNFALRGHLSQHNYSYWTGNSYLGIGPSAHSFNGRERCWNIRNNPLYIRSIRDHSFSPECETIDQQTAYNEYILTRLRTSSGINTNTIQNEFGVDFNAKFNPQLNTLNSEGKIEINGPLIKLTSAGFLWADDIAARFFIV